MATVLLECLPRPHNQHNQLSAMKINLDGEVQALLLLSSLPDSWNTLVVLLSNSAPDGKLTPKMVKNSLQNEEARRIHPV